MTTPKKVGIFLFPDMTMIDGYAPLQFFALAPDVEAFTFAKTADPIMSDATALLTPHYGFDTCPDMDVLLVPGGGNVAPQMKDRAVVDFLRQAGENAEFVTSVCTGSLILAETGLLDGHRAATHWAYTEALSDFPGIEQVDERVCVSGNRITGGGMTAGLDCALVILAKLFGEPVAHIMQLILEYRPSPMFNSGSPQTAPTFAVDAVRGQVDAIAAELFEHAKSKRVAA